jgi:hypothetical protein
VLGVTLLVPAVKHWHWWQVGLWCETAASVALGACYLVAAAYGMRPRRSAFTGLAMILFGVVWSLAPAGGWEFAAVIAVPAALMFVAVSLTARAANEDATERR